MKGFPRKILLLAVIMLLVVNALALDQEKIRGKRVHLWGEIWKGVEDYVTYFSGDLTQRAIFAYSLISNWIKDMAYLTFDDIQDHVLRNPLLDNPDVSRLIYYFVRILEPLYVAALILIGMYLIFFSGSPATRVIMKSAFLRLILSLIFVSLSLPIIKTLLMLSHSMTLGIIALGPADLGSIHYESIAYVLDKIQNMMVGDVLIGIPLMMFVLLLACGFFMLLMARYFLVIVFSALFPIAIFLLGFSPTRGVGRALLKHTFYWVFLPVSFALFLVMATVGENMLIAIIPELRDFYIAGTLSLILSPLAMLYVTQHLDTVFVSSSKRLSKLERRVIAGGEEPTAEALEEEEILKREVSGEVEFEAEAFKELNLEITPSKIRVSGKPGETSITQITVKNTGETILRDVTLQDIDLEDKGIRMRFIPSRFTLRKGEYKIINIEVTIRE